LGEPPGESGYPAYLSTRLAEFYERAARARTLRGDTGSVTVLSTGSPPSEDLSEPVVTHTKRYVRSFWALDSKRAQARIYPAINPSLSYAEETGILADRWRMQGNTRWPELRGSMLMLLQQQVKLDRMARIIGKGALAPAQQVRLLCA
jgi:V/A-type H+-transporting ATPase subunit A